MAELRDLICDEIPHLRRYAIALCRDRHRADDLVQDCLLRALKYEKQWHGTRLRVWLFRIMHNAYIDHVRRKGRENNVISMDLEGAADAGPGNQEATVQLREMERALAQLSEDQRVIVLLIGLEGMSYEEAAEVTEAAVGTVRSRLSRGRENLRRLLLPLEDRHVQQPASGNGELATLERQANE